MQKPSKVKPPKCNAPDCKKPAGGFLCREHSRMMPDELRKAVRRLWKTIPEDRRHERPFLLKTALEVIGRAR